MRVVKSFRVGIFTVLIGPQQFEHAGHRPQCCGYRRVIVLEPGAVTQDGRAYGLDVRQIRHDYRRRYGTGPRPLLRRNSRFWRAQRRRAMPEGFDSFDREVICADKI